MPYEMKTFDSNTYVPDLDENGVQKKGPKGELLEKRVCVGKVDVPQFTPDTAGLNDILSYYGDGGKEPRGGVAFLVNTFNTQNTTNARNALRQTAVKGPSEEFLQREALSRIMTSESLRADALAHGGDGAYMQKLMQEQMEIIKKEELAKRASSFQPAVKGEADEA